MLLVDVITDKAQHQIAGKIRDRLRFSEDFLKSFFQKPLVGFFLDLQKIRHFDDLFRAGKTLAKGLAVKDIFWHLNTLLEMNWTPDGVV